MQDSRPNVNLILCRHQAQDNTTILLKTDLLTTQSLGKHKDLKKNYSTLPRLVNVLMLLCRFQQSQVYRRKLSSSKVSQIHFWYQSER